MARAAVLTPRKPTGVFPSLPEGPSDFLFATEVVEHFHLPFAEWARMADLLKPGSLLKKH